MVSHWTQEFINWLSQLPPISIYLVFFAIAYLENVVPPIPGDILVVFGGYLAGESIIHLVPVYILTTIASVIGFMSVYTVGWFWGSKIDVKEPRSWLIRKMGIDYLPKVRVWMQRWGQLVIIANRFLAGARSIISITAGLSRTEPKRTALSALVSSSLWNGLLMGAGWVIQENWKIIVHYLSIYSQTLTLLVIIVVLLRLTWIIRQRKKQKEGGIS